MSFINRHEACIGIKLFKWKRKCIELWYCPRGYAIDPHRHPNIDIELVVLYGRATIGRRHVLDSIYRTIFVTSNWFKKYTILAEHYHYFRVSTKPFIFLSLELWRPGAVVTTAADDFDLEYLMPTIEVDKKERDLYYAQTR